MTEYKIGDYFVLNPAKENAMTGIPAKIFGCSTDRIKYPINVELHDLRLADVVEVFEGPFGTAVVTQITKDEVIMHRPYGVTGDFSYTGGVPYSVGNEVCKYLTCSAPGHYTFKVWQRKDLR